MKIRFGKNCSFCRLRVKQKCGRVYQWYRWLCGVSLGYCPHCFDSRVGLTRPAVPALVFWVSLYVAAYVSTCEPAQIAAYRWPDQRAATLRQTVFAPLIAADARVRERRLAMPAWNPVFVRGDERGSEDVREAAEQTAAADRTARR